MPHSVFKCTVYNYPQIYPPGTPDMVVVGTCESQPEILWTIRGGGWRWQEQIFLFSTTNQAMQATTTSIHWQAAAIVHLTGSSTRIHQQPPFFHFTEAMAKVEAAASSHVEVTTILFETIEATSDPILEAAFTHPMGSMAALPHPIEPTASFGTIEAILEKS